MACIKTHRNKIVNIIYKYMIYYLILWIFCLNMAARLQSEEHNHLECFCPEIRFFMSQMARITTENKGNISWHCQHLL